MRRARLLLPIADALALGIGTAEAGPLPATAEPHPTVAMPADLASSLSTNTPPVQVGFDQVATAADAGRLRVAVVDSHTRWVAATDASGNVVAARAPEPQQVEQPQRSQQAGGGGGVQWPDPPAQRSGGSQGGGVQWPDPPPLR